MDAVKFIETVYRMCYSYERCADCPFHAHGRIIGYLCPNGDAKDNAEELVSIVERWAKGHPAKTRQSEFLKVFPKTTIRNGVISVCPQFYCLNLLGTDFTECNQTDCVACRRKYWLAEVKDND